MKVLVSSIVCLFELGSIKKQSFEPKEMEGILSPPVSVGQTVDGRLVLTSVADQVEVFLSRDRFDVRDLSGKAPGKIQIGNIMAKVMTGFGGKLRAIGFNYEMSCDTAGGKESGEYIANMFLAGNDITKGLGVKGAAVTLYYVKNNKRCSVKIEPRWGDPRVNNVYMNFNMHEDIARRADGGITKVNGGELQDKFVNEFSQLLEVIKKFFK